MHNEYLWADLICASSWLFLYWHRQDLRKEMRIMSLLAAPLGLFDFLFVPNYWQPVTLFNIPVGIEGVIYSFFLGGMTAVIYAEVAHLFPVRLHHHHRKLALAVIAITLLTFGTLLLVGLPNIMLALYVALLLGVAIMLHYRKDLVRGTLLGALSFGLIYFISLKLWLTLFPGVRLWFTFEGIPKVFVLGVPLWEALFGVLFAAYWGNMYEILLGYRLVHRRTRKA